MLKTLRFTALVVTLLYSVFPIARSDNKDKLKDIPGCHPILEIRGNDGEPFFAKDCSLCINCVATSGNSCRAGANCSDDSEGCSQDGCPNVGCSCNGDANHVGCECDCSGDGVECSWTDSNNFLHDISKNCPTLP